MTNTQINDAIAEAIQWTGGWLARPYFCGDLNAMHEAEMCIPEGRQALYDLHLSAIVWEIAGPYKYENPTTNQPQISTKLAL